MMARAAKRLREAVAKWLAARCEWVEHNFRTQLQPEIHLTSLPAVIDGRSYEGSLTMPPVPVMIGVCSVWGKETVSESILTMEQWESLKASFQPGAVHRSNCQADPDAPVFWTERWNL
jgi:hypothetical protein